MFKISEMNDGRNWFDIAYYFFCGSLLVHHLRDLSWVFVKKKPVIPGVSSDKMTLSVSFPNHVSVRTKKSISFETM